MPPPFYQTYSTLRGSSCNKSAYKKIYVRTPFNHQREWLTISLSVSLDLLTFVSLRLKQWFVSCQVASRGLSSYRCHFLTSLVLYLHFLFYFTACEQISLDFVFSLTQTVSCVVWNLKTKHHRNKNFHYILELWVIKLGARTKIFSCLWGLT